MSPFAYGKALVTRIFPKVFPHYPCRNDSVGRLQRQPNPSQVASFFDYFEGFKVRIFFFINLKDPSLYHDGFHFL